MESIDLSLSIEARMEAAQARRQYREQLAAAEQAQRQADDLRRFVENLQWTFGDLLLALEAEPDAETDPFRALFSYRERVYSLRPRQDISYYWRLTRLDARSYEDDRPRPNTEIYAHRQQTIEERQDHLLLALAELDAEPALPWLEPRQPEAEAPAPARRPMHPIEERLLASMRDYIRDLASVVISEEMSGDC